MKYICYKCNKEFFEKNEAYARALAPEGKYSCNSCKIEDFEESYSKEDYYDKLYDEGFKKVEEPTEEEAWGTDCILS